MYISGEGCYDAMLSVLSYAVWGVSGSNESFEQPLQWDENCEGDRYRDTGT